MAVIILVSSAVFASLTVSPNYNRYNIIERNNAVLSFTIVILAELQS